MIRKIFLKGFKRFEEVTFTVPGHFVLAGPNNTGKTTLLQAIAAWELGFRKWLLLNNFNPRKNGYPWADLERLAFSAVAVRSFDLLWRDRHRSTPFEIGLQVDGLPMIILEFRHRADGLMQVRPQAAAGLSSVHLQSQRLKFRTTFIPAMSGLKREEQRLADQEAIDSSLAQGRPGEVLRNLLYMAYQNEPAWRTLNETIGRMFDHELLPPQAGEVLICEYRRRFGDATSPKFDIASAGSGFLQVLLLLTLLLTQNQEQSGSVLLIDEPDAHLHVILQKTIYGELRSAAAAHQAQLFVATHSEIVVDAVESRELCLMYGSPRPVETELEKARLIASLGGLTHSDILEANSAKGVLYTEDFTDIDILVEFSRILGHDAVLRLLTVDLVTKRAQAPHPEGLGDISPQKHWEMLKLITPDFLAVELLDGDSKNKGDESITGNAERMQRLRWRRYEIESYLIHPNVLQRFVESQLGGAELARDGVTAMLDELRNTLDQEFLENPLTPKTLVEKYFISEPVSKTLLPGLMQIAGLHNFPKSRYFEIAAQFRPDEIHPEVIEKLDKIKQAFGV
jgi:predicted ATPase